MEERPRLSELRERLVEGGAPCAYVDRLAGELEAHLEDACRAEMDAGKTWEEARRSAEARLGDLEGVVDEALRYAVGSAWVRRIPSAALLILPLLIVPLCWAVFLGVALYGGELLREMLGIDVRGGAARWYLQGVAWTAQYGVATAVAVAAYCWIGGSRRSRFLAWGAALAAAAVGSMTVVVLRWPDTATDVGTIVAAVASRPDWGRIAVTMGAVVAFATLGRRGDAFVAATD
jgi:hypothetical protein